MRLTPNDLLKDLWEAGGPFIGDAGAPHGRVTVEIGWSLRKTGGTVGNFTDGPVRWFQRSDNSQVETEVPNVKSISIDRSIDTDAATCTISIENTEMFAVGATGTDANEFGQPGFYSFSRGKSADAQSRWGQSDNGWQDILVPNALIRTYQGYGGRDKTIEDALIDGNILQSGLWLVDDVNITTEGKLELRCRDTGKLLIEQSLYPPIVPKKRYPLRYYRWIFIDNNHPVIPYGSITYKSGYLGYFPDTNIASSDLESAVIAGHRKEHAVDPYNTDTYWLSTGHATRDAHADMEWIQFTLDSSLDFDGFDMLCWGGYYTMYVSVMVGGVWQGSSTIPYTGSRYASGTYKAAIPYVQIMVPFWERPALYGLAQVYSGAQKVRFTFADLARSSVGPYFYRVGLRDVNVGNYTTTVSGNGKIIVGIEAASPDDELGYLLAGSDGGVFTFGNARFKGSRGGRPLNEPIVGIASNGDNTGYWLAGADGGVFSYGNVAFHGSLPSQDISVSNIVGIERSQGGDGYYLVGSDGAVYSFGDADYHGNNYSPGDTSFVGMAVKRTGSDGYWLADAVGNVYAHAGATHHGDAGSLSLASFITAIEGTPSGNGYYLASLDGGVFTYGDAQYHGNATSIDLNDPISDIAVSGNNSGYWLVGGDGGVFTFGVPFKGSLPGAVDILTKKTGNYQDYTTVIKQLLLWSGFWLYNSAITSSQAPEVFGNLETTGAFAENELNADFFDKKPVIDVIHAIKEIVGYIAYVDDIGAFHFESPNVWSIGNFFEDGTATDYIPDIDEEHQITQYSVAYADKNARSTITIASTEPTTDLRDTVHYTRRSTGGTATLRGIERPALWVNGAFTSKDEQRIMAELIDLHLEMSARQGSLTMPANPTLQINDQVRIWERQSGETYIHYVRGIQSEMDFETGQYTMTVNTHWMGDGDTFFIQYN